MNETMITLTIDPGKSGGVARWNPATGMVECWKMPETAHDLAELLEMLVKAFRPGDRAAMERVNSKPTDGHVGAFRFGENFGTLQGVLAAHRVPYELIAPGVWMKRVGALPKDYAERKNALKAFAQRRYPHLRVTLATGDALAMLAVLMDEEPGDPWR